MEKRQYFAVAFVFLLLGRPSFPCVARRKCLNSKIPEQGSCFATRRHASERVRCWGGEAMLSSH